MARRDLELHRAAVRLFGSRDRAPVGGWAWLAIGADGTLYVAMFGVLEARDPAAMGTVLWTLPLPGFNPSDNFIIGPDGTLYLPGFGGELAAVNPAASPAERLLWLKTVTDFSLRTPALSSDGTTLYVTVDSPNRLLAVSAQTGDPLWSRQYAWSEVGAPPVVAPDGTIYAAAPANDSFDNVGRLVAFTPDGTPKWIYTGGRMEGAPAVAKNGTVVVASKDGHLHAVSPQGTPIFVRSVLGLPESAVVIDRRGAAIVTGRCPYNHPTTCGITRVFTGADGPADSWSKEQGSLANTGRR